MQPLAGVDPFGDVVSNSGSAQLNDQYARRRGQGSTSTGFRQTLSLSVFHHCSSAEPIFLKLILPQHNSSAAAFLCSPCCLVHPRAPGGAYFPVGGYGVSGMSGGGGVGGGYGRASSSSSLGASLGSSLGSGDGQWLAQYLRRLWSWEQMDFESCFDQMVTLMGPSPSVINKVREAGWVVAGAVSPLGA